MVKLFLTSPMKFLQFYFKVNKVINFLSAYNFMKKLDYPLMNLDHYELRPALRYFYFI